MIHTLALWARQALLPRLTCMHAAAALLLLASGLANVRYGLSLAQSDLEKIIAVGASIGADLFSAVGVAAVAYALTKGEYAKAVGAGLVLMLTLMYAFIAGIGFASQTRSEVVGHRSAIVRTDKLIEADLDSTNKKLAGIVVTKNAQQIAAEMDAIIADPKAGGCRSLDGPYTKQHCPRYFELKAAHAGALERGRLETKRDELSSKLQSADAVVDSDPLATSMVAFVGKLGISVERDSLLPWLSLLFVALVVIGGPIALWLAEHRVPLVDLQPAKPSVPESRGRAAAVEEKTAEKTASEPTTRARRVSLTPVAGATLKKLKQRGGSVEGKTQSDIAAKLGVSRTSFRRVLDRLEEEKFVATSHDGKGYQVRVVH